MRVRRAWKSRMVWHRCRGGGHRHKVAGVLLAEVGRGADDGGANRLDRIEGGEPLAVVWWDPA
jgi:hypothetical protein